MFAKFSGAEGLTDDCMDEPMVLGKQGEVTFFRSRGLIT